MAFYSSPSSPVLREGFRATPNAETALCSADMSLVAVEIELQTSAGTIVVGDFFSLNRDQEITCLKVFVRSKQ